MWKLLIITVVYIIRNLTLQLIKHCFMFSTLLSNHNYILFWLENCCPNEKQINHEILFIDFSRQNSETNTSHVLIIPENFIQATFPQRSFLHQKRAFHDELVNHLTYRSCHNTFKSCRFSNENEKLVFDTCWRRKRHKQKWSRKNNLNSNLLFSNSIHEAFYVGKKFSKWINEKLLEEISCSCCLFVCSVAFRSSEGI